MAQPADTSALKCAIVILFVLNAVTLLALVVFIAMQDSSNNIASSLKMGNGLVMAMPSSDGTAGQVLTTDGLGTLSWASN